MSPTWLGANWHDSPLGKFVRRLIEIGGLPLVTAVLTPHADADSAAARRTLKSTGASYGLRMQATAPCPSAYSVTGSISAARRMTGVSGHVARLRTANSHPLSPGT